METADMQEQIGEVDDNTQVKITQITYTPVDIHTPANIVEFELRREHPPVEIKRSRFGQLLGSEVCKAVGSAVFSIPTDDSGSQFVEYIKSHLGDTVKWGDLWSHYKGCWNHIRVSDIECIG